MADEDLDSDPFVQLIAKVFSAGIDDRLAVILTNAYLEAMVDTLIEENLKNGKQIKQQARDFPYATKLLLLNELGIISDKLYRAAKKFKKIRNSAAHEHNFKVNMDTLHAIADDYGHGKLFREDIRGKALPRICILLANSFFNEQPDTLLPIYSRFWRGAQY